MIDWWVAGVATSLTLLSYVAFFWKINWVRHLNLGKGYGSNVKNRKPGKLPPVYPNGWFALLESWQLAKGEVKHVAALGENFAIFRTEKGEAKVLNAYCPHLGANIAEGGTVRGDCLECPFHSWLFNGNDGRCESIPYAKKIPETAKTKAWHCCEVNNFIFVWYHAESMEPYWQLQPMETIRNGAWQSQGRNEFYVNCHTQEIPENGADRAHFGTVHGPGIIFSFLNGFIRHSWTNSMWTSKTAQNLSCDDEIDETIESKMESDRNCADNHRAIGKLRHQLLFFERYSIMELNVTADQIGPGYVEMMIETSFGSMCILQTVTPLEPLLQRVTHTMYSPPLLAPYAKIVLIGESIMFERDVAVWNHKKFEKRPLLVREDRTISAFRRWYEQFYTANSPTYQSVMALDW